MWLPVLFWAISVGPSSVPLSVVSVMVSAIIIAGLVSSNRRSASRAFVPVISFVRELTVITVPAHTSFVIMTYFQLLSDVLCLEIFSDILEFLFRSFYSLSGTFNDNYVLVWWYLVVHSVCFLHFFYLVSSFSYIVGRRVFFDAYRF